MTIHLPRGLSSLGATVCDGDLCYDDGSSSGDSGSTNLNACGADGYDGYGVSCSGDQSGVQGGAAEQPCFDASGNYTMVAGGVCPAGTFLAGSSGQPKPGAVKSTTPVVKTDLFTSLLNSITGKGVTTTPTTSAACAASGGTWSGTKCTPKAQTQSSSMLLYALIGIGAIALLKKR